MKPNLNPTPDFLRFLGRTCGPLGPRENLRLIEDVEEINHDVKVLTWYRGQTVAHEYEKFLDGERAAARALPPPRRAA
jgi:hypothetical protein